MKLAYLSTARVPDDWAHVFHIMHMCEAFAHQGAEVKLVVPRRGATPTGGRQDPFEYNGVESNFTIVRLPCLDLFPGTTSRLLFYIRNISFFISARFYLWFIKVDVIYTREAWAGYFFRNFFFEAHTAQGRSLLFSGARSIVCLTSFIKDIFVKRGFPARNILVEPDAVNLKQFAHLIPKVEARTKCGLPQDKSLIGYVGTLKTMNIDKGLHAAITAMKAVPEAMLVVVGGDREHVEEYRSLAEHGGLASRVIFTGTVAHSNVATYLSSFDIVVAPFPDIEHYRLYMSPLKIFEYMAAGLPMIVSDLPSLREILDEKIARFVPPSDAEALGEAINDLLAHPDMAAALGQAAKIRAEHYSWDKRAGRILKFIQGPSL